MAGLTIYLIGAIVAFIICLRLIYKEQHKYEIQYDMIAPCCIMSWIFVGLALWKLRDKIF